MNADDAPWETPEMALRVGDRVVVGLGGEWGDKPTDPRMDGLAGTVVAIDEPGHPFRYYVALDDFDDPGIPLDDPAVRGHIFARSELRRLAARESGAGDGDTRE